MARALRKDVPKGTVRESKAFPSEMNFHFPGLDNLDKPSVGAFPELQVCLDCGITEVRLRLPKELGSEVFRSYARTLFNTTLIGGTSIKKCAIA